MSQMIFKSNLLQISRTLSKRRIYKVKILWLTFEMMKSNLGLVDLDQDKFVLFEEKNKYLNFRYSFLLLFKQPN